jgi:hypothetical protein
MYRWRYVPSEVFPKFYPVKLRAESGGPSVQCVARRVASNFFGDRTVENRRLADKIPIFNTARRFLGAHTERLSGNYNNSCTHSIVRVV